MKHAKQVLVGMVLLSFAGGMVIGSVVLTSKVNSSINLMTSYVEVLGENGSTRIDALDFGTLFPNQENGKIIYIRNLTEEQLRVSWNSTNLPAGVSLKVMKHQNEVWSIIQENTDLVTLGASQTVKMTVTAKFNNGSGGLKNFEFNVNSYMG